MVILLARNRLLIDNSCLLCMLISFHCLILLLCGYILLTFHDRSLPTYRVVLFETCLSGLGQVLLQTELLRLYF